MSGLNLDKLEEKLNNALSNETSESLNNWLEQKRMSNNKQSSVEWLYEKLFNCELNIFEWQKHLEQAKEMHKTEHFNTWWHGISENEPITFEQYYNETYGGNND